MPSRHGAVVAGALVVCLLAVTAAALSTDQAFAQADKNHNGSLDKGEFAAFAERLQAQIASVLGNGEGTAAKLDSAGGGSLGVPTWLAGGPGFWGGFVSGVGMIIATEIGDKTFFIAAIMAMQYSRMLVFAGAITALAIMTVLSAALGFALPNILPREYTHYAGALLFLYFGVKMLKEGFEADDGGPSEELAEVEQELMLKRSADEGDVEQTPHSGNGSGGGAKSDGHKNGSSGGVGGGGADKKDAWGVFSQGLTLTFLAEWGDRSQIATIALAAAKDVVGVTVGGILGHSLCTGMAVVGGRLLAARISERTVHLVGGGLFLVFGLHSLIFGL